MDSVDSSVLSPSGERRESSEPRDWAYITSWLQRKYAAKQVPLFERNEDTLKTLLNLAAANDSADEERNLLHRAREEVVQHLQTEDGHTSGSNPARRLIEAIETSIDRKTSTVLEDLAETSVVLGTLNPAVADVARSVVDLSREEFDITEQTRTLSTLQSYLDRELEIVGSKLDRLNDGDIYETPADLPTRTDELLRDTELFDEQISEYQDKLTAAENARYDNQGPHIKDLTAEEESVVALRETVKALEDKVKAFHGLPPNIREAEEEYERLEREYRFLLQKRGRMSENIYT